MADRKTSELSRTWQEEWDRWTGFSHASGYDLAETSQREIAEHFFDIGKMSGLHNATKHLGPHITPPPRKWRKGKPPAP